MTTVAVTIARIKPCNGRRRYLCHQTKKTELKFRQFNEMIETDMKPTKFKDRAAADAFMDAHDLNDGYFWYVAYPFTTFVKNAAIAANGRED